MKYKQFQDISLSRLGFGNMRLPEKDGRINREKASAMIDRAMRGGVSYYDTAWMYHGEDSETFLGEVLPQYPRDSFYLATKFNIGFNPDYRHVFETQLKKLKTRLIRQRHTRICSQFVLIILLLLIKKTTKKIQFYLHSILR